MVHLQPSGLHSRYTDHDVGQGFQSPQLAAPLIHRKETPPAGPAAQPGQHFISAPRMVGGKGIPQKDLFVPSMLHPEIVPERPFWDYERKRKAAVAWIVALSGIFYLMFALGFFRSLVAKPRYEDEPRI